MEPFFNMALKAKSKANDEVGAVSVRVVEHLSHLLLEQEI